MKARVDSGELARAVTVAAKWSTSGVADITQCIGMLAEENALHIRSTRLHTNCLVRVNAFDVEPGEAVVLAKHLDAVAYDTGSDVVLRTTKAKVFFESERSVVRLDRRDETMQDFPEWPEYETKISVPADQLLVACSSTKAPSDAGFDFLTAIHLLTNESTTFVMGVDGVVGTLSEMELVVPRSFAMDAQTAKSALQNFDSRVTLAIEENTVEISATGSPVKISFSLMGTPDRLRELVDSLFLGKVNDDDLALGEDGLAELILLCKRAMRIDDLAEVAIMCRDGVLSVTIAGDGVGIESVIDCTGNLRRAVMFCKTFLQCAGSARSSETYEIKTMPWGDDKDVGRVWLKGADTHVIGCSAGGRLGQ